MKLTILLGFVLMIDLFLLLWIAVGMVKDKRLFTSAPKDIQEVALEHDEDYPGQRYLGWFLLMLCAAVYAGTYVYGAYDGIRNGFGFWDFFFRFLIMSYLLKAFDIIFLDYFLLTKSHFFQHYYPETQGCEGYHSFGFNRREQLTRIVLYPFFCAFLSFACVLIEGHL
ncbi:MAG: hypothetical protein K5908_09770 [Erysipelotrichaceae bacterium]|jgi:hypothetical protein|nr:hypothetical protein [Erysipelotrichaceae bacterium]